jgi:hypothetical protein
VSELASEATSDVNIYVHRLEETVNKLLDVHAPSKIITRNLNKNNRINFLTPAVSKSKKNRRRLERIWRRSKLPDSLRDYRQACSDTNTLIKNSRMEHIKRTLASKGSHTSSRWKYLKSVLHEDQQRAGTTPPASTISSYFSDKIMNINHVISSRLTAAPDPFYFDPPATETIIPALIPTSPHEVLKLIHELQIKPSPVDKFPARLIKQCPRAFSVYISRLANLSFSSGVFPTAYKCAQVTPLLKKPGLDSSLPSSFRPISNLNTISKIIERLVLARIQSHILNSRHFNQFQSAYRPLHSTESALLRTLNDVYNYIGG